ncbi:hypothetical protein [Lentisalinibacter salinarum]|uniref:hypothetical protein n=1 Tax=Lentisalinibacter salinarum TaxID=2992239 RepID=UPI00386C0D81
MKKALEIGEKDYDRLMAHLVPGDSNEEQAAFLFATCQKTATEIRIRVIGAQNLGRDDFVAQHGYYIEMQDGTRASLIKRAHDLGASLIEVHSHLGPWPAEFSASDRHGLRETVPHMFWRLNKRPYIALVVTESDFDALVWIDDPRIPERLDQLRVGQRILSPTNRSLRGWK